MQDLNQFSSPNLWQDRKPRRTPVNISVTGINNILRHINQTISAYNKIAILQESERCRVAGFSENYKYHIVYSVRFYINKLKNIVLAERNF